MIARPPERIVLLGILTQYPVAGVVWQVVHYLVGLERLGYEAYYVEAGGHQPSFLLEQGGAPDRSENAARFLSQTLGRFGFERRWAFHALHHDGRCYGMSRGELDRLYHSASLLINLHGATTPLPEHRATGRLVYLETDPVALQVELAEERPETIAFLEPHRAFFTFAENYGRPDCGLPVSSQFAFRPTRQPVVLDFWSPGDAPASPHFTTIGNWAQQRTLTFQGEAYTWSKQVEFEKFLDLPRRSGWSFELALSRCPPADRSRLEAHGWKVRDAMSFSTDVDRYRRYIQGSRGEFTVAKDQNVRFRSGWFSDRSASYLAAGRPVITQETGFSSVIPTGEGLFSFSSQDDILAAVEAIDADYPRHRRAALALAREYFSHDVVLPRLLREAGL